MELRTPRGQEDLWAHQPNYFGQETGDVDDNLPAWVFKKGSTTRKWNHEFATSGNGHQEFVAIQSLLFPSELLPKWTIFVRIIITFSDCSSSLWGLVGLVSVKQRRRAYAANLEHPQPKPAQRSTIWPHLKPPKALGF